MLAATLSHRGTALTRQRQLFAEAQAGLDHRPDLRAWAAAFLGVVSTAGVSPAEDVAWLDRAVHLAAGLDNRLLEVFVRGKAGALLMHAGDPGWRRHADRVLDLTGGTARLRWEANAYNTIGGAACYAGHLEIAERMLTTALTVPAMVVGSRMRVVGQTGLALLDFVRGEWAGLPAQVDLLLAQLADAPTVRADDEVVAGELALARGELTVADRHLRAAMELVREVDGHWLVPVLVAGSAARVALARGDVQTGLAAIQTIVDVLDTKGVWAPVAWALPTMVEVLLAADAPGRARELVDRAAAELDSCDAPLAPAALAQARGLLTASGDWADAAGWLTASAELYQQIPVPYRAAQAAEAAARCLFETGDDRAEATLRTALATYHRLGATWDAARAAGLARRHGAEPPWDNSLNRFSVLY